MTVIIQKTFLVPKSMCKKLSHQKQYDDLWNRKPHLYFGEILAWSTDQTTSSMKHLGNYTRGVPFRNSILFLPAALASMSPL